MLRVKFRLIKKFGCCFTRKKDFDSAEFSKRSFFSKEIAVKMQLQNKQRKFKLIKNKNRGEKK
jgi:hypothetical protein